MRFLHSHHRCGLALRRAPCPHSAGGRGGQIGVAFGPQATAFDGNALLSNIKSTWNSCIFSTKFSHKASGILVFCILFELLLDELAYVLDLLQRNVVTVK